MVHIVRTNRALARCMHRRKKREKRKLPGEGGGGGEPETKTEPANIPLGPSGGNVNIPVFNVTPEPIPPIPTPVGPVVAVGVPPPPSPFHAVAPDPPHWIGTPQPHPHPPHPHPYPGGLPHRVPVSLQLTPRSLSLESQVLSNLPADTRNIITWPPTYPGFTTTLPGRRPQWQTTPPGSGGIPRMPEAGWVAPPPTPADTGSTPRSFHPSPTRAPRPAPPIPAPPPPLPVQADVRSQQRLPFGPAAPMWSAADRPVGPRRVQDETPQGYLIQSDATNRWFFKWSDAVNHYIPRPHQEGGARQRRKQARL